MSWTAFHSRGETLRAVVDTANAAATGSCHGGARRAENFTDEIDLVGALLLKWHARLSGNIERALMREPMDLEAAVATPGGTAEQLPGVRLVIDRRSRHDPEMADDGRAASASGSGSPRRRPGQREARAVEAGRVEELAREGLAA